MTSVLRGGLVTLGAAVTLLLAAGTARAGQISLSWAPSHDEVTAGYELEVLDADGQVSEVYDVKKATRFTVDHLADGIVYKFRIRPYDEWGNKAAEPSRELTAMPAPRVDAVERWSAQDRDATFVLVGVNFAPGARVVPLRADMSVISAVPVTTTELSVQVRQATVAAVPLASDFLVVNPVRRSENYLKKYPPLLDVNHSGLVDQADLDLVTRAFGTMAGSAGYTPDLDVNGDGVIDGEDAAPIRALMGVRAPVPGASSERANGHKSRRDVTNDSEQVQLDRRATGARD